MKEIRMSNSDRMIMVDDEDYDYLSQFKWRNLNGYARTGTQSVCMHRLLMELPKGDKRQVDHLDHVKHNNQKHNLRICTRFQNNGNRLKSENKTSNFRGVSIHADGGWQVRCAGHWCGRFLSEEDAAQAYDAKALEVFGEFANLNFKS